MGNRIAIALMAVTLPGCAGSPLENLIATADTAYAHAVEICDAKERAIVERPCALEQTQEQCETKDRADLTKVREACDRIFEAFEVARKAAPALKDLSEIKL